MKKPLLPICIVSAVIAAFPLQASLIAQWTFSNGSNLGQDSSGNGNDLTGTGGAGPQFDASGRGGLGAAIFNGSDWFVDLSGFPSGLPTGDSPYTLMAWIQLGTTNPGAYGIIGWGNYGTGSQVNAFRTAGPAGLDNYWWGNDNVALQGAGTDNIYDGNWHLVAATWDGTTRTVYVDPQLGNGYSNSDTPGSDNSQSLNFTVGQTNGGESFIGELSNVAVYNTALTESQIASSETPEPTTLLLVLPALALLRLAFRRSAGAPEFSKTREPRGIRA